MSQIGDVITEEIRLRWPKNISKVGKPNYKGIVDWLDRGVYGWSQNPSGILPLLDVSTTSDDLSQAFAAEIGRFSSAAYESLLYSAPPLNESKSLAWSLIRYYYAAFYSAHALHRIVGQALTYIPKVSVDRLNAVSGQYFGVAPKFSSGLYFLKRCSSLGNQFELELISGGGGSHEDMWERFLKLLKILEDSIILNQGQLSASADALDVIKNLRIGLCFGGKNNGSWLSVIRNSINYKHDHGLWYPYSLSKEDSRKLVEKMGQWKSTSQNDFMGRLGSHSLHNFVDLVNMLARILLISLRDISKRSIGTVRNFVDLQPLRLLKTQKIL